MGGKDAMEYCSILLNDHNEYLKVLEKLKNKTQYIEYVLVDKKNTYLIEQLKNNILKIKLVNQWWGTETFEKHHLYKINATSESFEFLKRYSTFCMVKNHKVIQTDFGINDIAFLDNKGEPLLFTTTHEGYIDIRKDLII